MRTDRSLIYDQQEEITQENDSEVNAGVVFIKPASESEI